MQIILILQKDSSLLHQQNSSRFSQEQRTGVKLIRNRVLKFLNFKNPIIFLVFFGMTDYTKRPISIEEQIDLLKKYDLKVDNKKFASKVLSEVSFFRLKCYFNTFLANKKAKLFCEGTKFEHIVSLYNFDRKLRSIIFTSFQRFEIALRTKMIQYFSVHGPFWFAEERENINDRLFQDNLATIDKELKCTKEDFIMAHLKKYKSPKYPPAWKTLEIISFGTLVKLYCNFADKAAKEIVAEDFRVGSFKIFESWLRCLSLLRNFSAHHARIWNRNFSSIPKMPDHLDFEWINVKTTDSSKLYALLCIFAYLLDSLDDDSGFKSRIKKLVGQYSKTDISLAGFPRNWKNEPLWK